MINNKTKCYISTIHLQNRVPDRNEKQHERSKSRARKLYYQMLTKNTGCIIMDGETYNLGSICTCGRRSKPYVARGTISSQNYIKECLEKRLLPFIRSHNISSIFWPDLAPAHYSNLTMTWYRDNNIKIVPKDMNPPNCPELRPIELIFFF